MVHHVRVPRTLIACSAWVGSIWFATSAYLCAPMCRTCTHSSPDSPPSMVCGRIEFLSKFSPVPSPHVPSFAAALVERLARRVLAFFVRHAALLRPLSQAGKLQLAKVCRRRRTVFLTLPASL